MNVAVSAVPEHWFIVEVIVFYATGCRSAVKAYQMSDPVLNESGGNGDAGISGLVASNIGAVRMDTIAAIGVPRVGVLLRSVFGHLESAVERMLLNAPFCYPSEQRYRHNRFGAGAAVLFNKLV